MDFDRVAKANETLDIAFEISRILDTGLDRKTVSLLIALCENGVNPEVLCQSSPAIPVCPLPHLCPEGVGRRADRRSDHHSPRHNPPPRPQRQSAAYLSAVWFCRPRRWRRSSRSSVERRQPSERHRARQHAELERQLCWRCMPHGTQHRHPSARSASTTQAAQSVP